MGSMGRLTISFAINIGCMEATEFLSELLPHGGAFAIGLSPSTLQ
jgi:hypothetical protein